jgi:uncharacterized membrane protein YdjX (TVP38/TMEM64 family)
VVGSLAGCIWLYLLAKKGGEAYYRRRAGQSPGRLRVWMQDHAFGCIFAASLLPPPMPFKPFVLVAGVLQVRPRTFALSILAGRSLRYFLEGWLAIRYGPQATVFLLAHKWGFIIVVIVVVSLGALLSRWISRAPANAQ